MKTSEIKTKVLVFLKANLFLLVVVTVIGFLFGRGCEQKSLPPSGVDEKEHSRIVMELAAARDSIHIVDSVAMIERAARKQMNEAAAKERSRLQDQARKSAENASYWQGVAKQADEVKDSETGLAARDSQITALYEVISLRNLELQQVDSIIYRKDLDIALLDAANTAKSDLIDRQHITIEKLNTDFQKLVVENKDLRKAAKKKRFWGGFWGSLKTGGAAAGGFILGRAIK